MSLVSKTAFIIVALLLSLHVVEAWGVQPARQRGSFTTETQYLSVTLENTDGSEGYFQVSFSGELAPYARYAGPVVYLGVDDREYIIPFSLKLPSQFAPGLSTLSVNLKQVAGGVSTMTVSSLITLTAHVNVDVPYQDDAITAQLSIGMAEAEDPSVITVSVRNRGKEAVAVWADIAIKGPTNLELASWQTEKRIFEVDGAGKIVSEWAGAREPGVYHAEVVVHYGDKEMLLRQSFMVGSKEVVSESVGSSSFRLGGIVPVDIGLRNKWNERIEDVFAEVYVLTKEGGILQSFKTASDDVDALGRRTIVGYWDTAKIVVGNYDLNVVVHYDDRQSQRSYPVTVKADELVVGSLTGKVISGAEDDAGQYSLLIILIVVLIIVNVLVIVYFKRTMRKK